MILLLITIQAWTYEPLTDEEILNYWGTLTQEEKIEEIRKLDLLEHSLPVIEGLQYIAIITKEGDLIIYPKNAVILSLGYLLYEIDFPEHLIEDFVIPKEKKKYFLAGAGGWLVAMLTTAATGEEDLIKYGINSIVGILIGLTTELLR